MEIINVKFAVTLLIGIFLGIGYSKLTYSEPTPKPCQCDPCPAIVPPSEVPAASSTQSPEAQPLNPVDAGSAVAANPASADSAGHLSITSQQVDEMEEDWDDLVEQVRVIHEGNNWRVVYLEPDSVFSRAGFHQDQVITHESVDELGGSNPETRTLSERFARILDHVATP